MLRCLPILLVLASVAAAAPRAPKPGDVHHLESPKHGHPFSLYVPSDYSPRSSWPVVISSHGRGGSGKGEIGQWTGLTRQHGFIVACPDMCTATVDRPPRSKLPPEVEDEEVILSILEFLRTSYRVNPRAVMLTGFSGGGNPSYWTGLRHPDLVSHICTRGGNFAIQQVPRDETVLVAGRKSLEIYIYYGENDHPLILGEGGKPGQAVAAHQALTAAGYANVAIEKIPAMKHESRPGIAATWFGTWLGKNKRRFAAGDKADALLQKAREAVGKERYRQAIRELEKMAALEEKEGLRPRAPEELASIDAVGAKQLAEAKTAFDGGDAAEAARLAGRVAREFSGVPSGEEAKRLAREWKP